MDDVNIPNIKLKPRRGLRDWFSPFGVITGSEFTFRLAALLGMIILLIFARIFVDQPSSPFGREYDPILKFVAGLFAFLPIFLWGIFANLTKRYRTRGVVVPGFFALVTMFMPVLALFVWLFASPMRRLYLEQLAQQQRNGRGLKVSLGESKNHEGSGDIVGPHSPEDHITAQDTHNKDMDYATDQINVDTGELYDSGNTPQTSGATPKKLAQPHVSKNVLPKNTPTQNPVLRRSDVKRTQRNRSEQTVRRTRR